MHRRAAESKFSILIPSTSVHASIGLATRLSSPFENSEYRRGDGLEPSTVRQGKGAGKEFCNLRERNPDFSVSARVKTKSFDEQKHCEMKTQNDSSEIIGLCHVGMY